MINTNPPVGSVVRHCKNKELGTVTQSSGDSFTIAWHRGAVIQGYDQRHHVDLEMVYEKPNYAAIGSQVGELVTAKQAAYGDSFGRAHVILRELYPNGISPDQYRDMLAVTRIIDKLFRIANAKDAFGESPYRDIAGYALLGLRETDRK